MKLISYLKPFAIRTTPRAVLCLSAWTMLMFGAELLSLIDGLSVLSMMVLVLRVMGVILAVVFLWEYIRLMRAARAMPQIQIIREIDANLPVHEHSEVTLVMYHPDLPAPLKKLNYHVMDYFPKNTQTDELPVGFHGTALHQSGEEVGVRLVYSLYAHERGVGEFGGVDWLISTPLNLLQKYHHSTSDQIRGVHTVRIMANFKALVQGNLLAISKNSTVGGLIKRKRKGQGQDFHQIRAYSEGDSIRHIDWKATARHQRLMSREYQDEADQEIIFLLDCGQHMRHIRFNDPTVIDEAIDYERSSHLDMALNAMLLLAQVANKQADATGFISFGAVADKIAPAKKGANVISYLLNQSFELQPSMKAPDYMAVARQALSIQKRRSLMVLITNLRTDNSDELFGAINLLTQKHRVVVANLYEQDLKDYLTDLPETLDDALTYHSVRAYLDSQRQLNIRLSEETGAMVVSSTPQELPQKLIDAYWAVRRWGVA